MLNIKLLGVKEVTDRLDHILHGKHSRFGQALEKVAIQVESTAKREGFRKGPKKVRGESKSARGAKLRPVQDRLTARTGRLRGSITHRVDKAGLRAWVGSNVIYARIHELSGRAGRNHASFIPARPYLQPAVETNRRLIEQLFARDIDKLLDGK